MSKSHLLGAVCACTFGIISSAAQAVIVDFTGGTVTQIGGATATTANDVNYDNVDFYVQDGIKVDFEGADGDALSYNVGDYYDSFPVGNDVAHGHWDAGIFGDMTSIRVTKTDDSAFDLNYFLVTTNTEIGGDPATGNEVVYVNALADGTNTSFSMQLPSEDWGFPGSPIYLGTEFDGVKAVSFTWGSNAVGLGLDDLYIDQAAPPIPVPAAVWLFGSGLLGLIGISRRKKAA